ncbi:MAG: hypothetical protein ABL964_06200 [Steroidobacteraceae bacterium]
MKSDPNPALPLSAAFTTRAGAFGWARSVIAVAALSVALMLPALWNGYPVLYFDTVDYVSMGFTWKLPIYRTAGYGFLALAGWAAHTIWATLILQAVIAAYVLFESWRLLTPDLRGWRLAALLVFAFTLTSLPWVASTIMPDIFTAPAVLLCLLLALRDDALTPARRWAFIVLLGLACMAHPTHVTMVAGLLICIWVMSLLARRGWPFVPMKVGGVAAGMVLGVVLSLATNWMVTGRVFLAPRTTPLLTFAVLFEEGLGERYLAETCDKPEEYQSVFCPYRYDLPDDANQFLWHNGSLWKAGGWEKVPAKSAEDLKVIIKRYPLEFVTGALKLTAEQLVVIRTGEGFRTMGGFIDKQVSRFYPGDDAAFNRAHQQKYPEVADSPIPAINLVQVPVMLACLVLLVGVVATAMWRRERVAATLAALVLLAYLGNAFICGAISNPADRYGSRLAWLTAITAVLMLARLVKRDASGTSSAAG